jgi:hypothetical protein
MRNELRVYYTLCIRPYRTLISPNVKRLCIVESINKVLAHPTGGAHTHATIISLRMCVVIKEPCPVIRSAKEEEGHDDYMAFHVRYYTIHFETLSNLTLTHKRAREGRVI